MIPINLKDKNEFINNFLSPISKLTENTVLKVAGDRIKAVSSSNDGTLIVSCNYMQDNEIEDSVNLNIPDISKLTKVLTCIEDNDILLSFNNNNIEYSSKSVGFKYHLLEDGIIEPPSVDINKIKKIDFNFKFKIPYNIISSLIKGSTFTTETDKIYFHTTDEGVSATLTDQQRHNVDSYTQHITDKYSGNPLESALSLNFETMRILSSIRFDELNVMINPELNVFLFDISVNNTKINIISSGYVG